MSNKVEVKPYFGNSDATTKSMEQSNGKAYSRLPLWAEKPHQINHKIMKAYFSIRDKKTMEADRDEMRVEYMKMSQGSKNYTFDINLNSMLTDKGNSHGKVFEVINNRLVLAKDIRDLAEGLKPKFELSEFK